MKKYERNSNKEIPKPLYYSDYYITENTENTNNICLVTVLLTIFIFGGSIADLFYSYMKIDNCQNTSISFSTLNDWLRVNGIFGICYYFFMIIVMYAFYYNEGRNHINNGYTKMANNVTKEKSENREILYKVSLNFFTIVMLILFSIGFYIYFIDVYSYCKSYAIIVYMWVRIITGFLSSIGLFLFINY